MSSSCASARDLRFSASVMFRISALDDNLQPTTTSVIQSVIDQSVKSVSQLGDNPHATPNTVRQTPPSQRPHASDPTLPTTTRPRPHPPRRLHGIFSRKMSIYLLHDIYLSGSICLSAPALYLFIFLSCVVASERHAAARCVPPPNISSRAPIESAL